MVELFTAGVAGIASILKKEGLKKKIKPLVTEPIKLRAPDNTVLLIDFLSEIVGRAYAQKVLYQEVQFLKLTDKAVSAKLVGIPVADFDEDVKAVTYHEANITKNKKGMYETIIVLDI